jgi:hypothetical protein
MRSDPAPGAGARLFVPGRVCLFGEHSDWAGGYRRVNPQLERGRAIICGTDQGIHAAVARHPDSLVLTSVVGGDGAQGPRVIPMDAAALLDEAQRGGFWSYVAGVAHQALARHPVRGLALDNDRMDLPVRKGLSSSAAACVLTARAFNRLYDLGLTVREEMELAYEGEITTPSRCGRMDQGCAFGQRPVVMEFDCERLEVAELTPGREIHLIVVDLAARKDTRVILASLHRAFPFAANEVARGVQALLGPINRDIVGRAADALAAGDAARLGGLMIEAQEQFDRLAVPACPEELTAPVLHRVLRHEALLPHVWGGKGVGSQGDGSAQFVARGAQAREAAISVIERDLGMACLRLTITP